MVWTLGLAVGLAVLLLFTVSFLLGLQPRDDTEQLKATAREPETLVGLLSSSPRMLEGCDIALMNLLCAEPAPGQESVDIVELRQQLDSWAAHIRTETRRHLYRFKRNPSEYDESEAYFRMLMMAVVLHEDFGVRYNPALKSAPGAGTGPFFANSADVFLHGLLGERRLGTCSSMPVLYVALGRRLGYPVFLVATKGHLFVRWEGRGERLNLEATGRGMNRYDDAHYCQWPFPVSDEEIAENGYLKSMTAAEELAAFLSIRGACLQENGRLDEAMEAFGQAARLAPRCLLYRQLAARLGEIDAVATYGPQLAPRPDRRGAEVSGWSENPATLIEPNPRRTLSQQTY